MKTNQQTFTVITCLAFLIILGVVFNDIYKKNRQRIEKDNSMPGYILDVSNSHTGFQIGEHYIWKAVEHDNKTNTTTFDLVPLK